ncbi:MAG: LysO family transporter [Candidatus Promineifilaceae bacterium]|nr:LysO family transporter [Candidatus Promineifilaceae bacterium]
MLFLAVLGGGMLAGFLLRQKRALVEAAERLSSFAIYLLLFLLGLSVGGDEAIFSRLPALGLQALLLSAAAIAGSVALTALLNELPHLKKKGDAK